LLSGHDKIPKSQRSASEARAGNPVNENRNQMRTISLPHCLTCSKLLCACPERDTIG
jgi:hypothetical protein